jgi:methyl-accepting chemotaxis protein
MFSVSPMIQRFKAWFGREVLNQDQAAASLAALVNSPTESQLILPDVVDQVFEQVERMVIDRIRGVNKLTESEVLSVGDALQRIVKEARAHVDATRETLSEIANDRSDESVTGLVSRQASRSENFLGRVEALIAQQGNHADHAVALTRRISELGERVSSIAFQSRLLSLNASVEAARMNGQGAAFGVISVEMKRLSDAVEEANKGVAELAEELTDALPNIARVGSELLQCSQSFRVELEGGLREIQDATSALKSTIGNSLSDGDKRIDRVISESNSALSHLQFQDVCAQSLLIIDKDLDNTRVCIRSLVEGAGVAAARVPADLNFTLEKATSNREKATGEVIVLNDGPQAVEAGEVMLF